MVKFFV